MIIGSRDIESITITDENNVLMASITDENVVSNSCVKVTLAERSP